MARRIIGKVFVAMALLWALRPAGGLGAESIIGTWVWQPGGQLTMTVEACCNGGRRFTYSVPGRTDVVSSVDSPMDGSEAPLLIGGKPTGETMAIKRLDDHHTLTVLKMNGKTFGTSKATLSADGRTLTVENEITMATGGHATGKGTEIWMRK